MVRKREREGGERKRERQRMIEEREREGGSKG